MVLGGKPGRPPIDGIALALARRLVATPLGTRGIVRELADREIHLSRITVRRIRQGTHRSPLQSTSRLAPGETRPPEPIVCPRCNNLIDVVPCRVCSARSYQTSMRELIAAQGASQDVQAGPRPPRRPRRDRTYRDDPNAHDALDFDLAADEAERLEEIRRRRQTG